MPFIPHILGFVFIILALIHFNWARGGTWAFDNTLPVNEHGERIINPRKTDSAIVGVGLLLFALFYLNHTNLFHIDLPDWLFNVGGWIIPGIFILRAIGEFKYVGFFKKIKSTKFGELDSKLYSPLCLVIGILGILVKLS